MFYLTLTLLVTSILALILEHPLTNSQEVVYGTVFFIWGIGAMFYLRHDWIPFVLSEPGVNWKRAGKRTLRALTAGATVSSIFFAITFAASPAAAEDSSPTIDSTEAITLLYHLSTTEKCYVVDYPVELPQAWKIAGISFYKSFTDEDEAHAYAAARGLCVHAFGFVPEEMNLLTGALLKWQMTDGFSVWNPVDIINTLPQNPYEDAALRAQGDYEIALAKTAFAELDAQAADKLVTAK